MSLRLLALIAVLIGGLLGSQAPEFAQQLYQRLEGRADIALARRAEIEADARSRGLETDAYVALFLDSPVHALEGRRMQASLARAAEVARLREGFAAASDLTRPLLVLGTDRDLALAAARAYRPALPLSPAGLLYGLVSAAFVALALAAARGVLRSFRWTAARGRAAP